MSTGDLVLLLASLNLLVWAVMTVVAIQRRKGGGRIPDASVAGTIAAVLAACIGGWVTAWGYRHVIDADLTAMVGAAWRSGMAIAGLYAIWAAIAAARARRG